MNNVKAQRISPADAAVRSDASPRPIAVTDAAECCTWCGLPARSPCGRRSRFQTAESDVAGSADENQSTAEDIYCCFGCRIAHGLSEECSQRGYVRGTVVRLGLAVFFTMNLMAFTMVSWSPDIYGNASETSANRLLEVFRWLSMLLSLPVLLLLGIPLLQNAVISIRQRIYSTDLLIALGVTAAFTVSAWNVVQGSGAIYFEVGATVLVMVTLGRWFEAVGRQRATESLDTLSALLPTTAQKSGSAGTAEISSADISPGDQLQIRPGERFPTDGRLLTGQTTVDEQIFTGESTPVSKSCGDTVLGGTVNLVGLVLVESSSTFRGGSFGRLLTLLQEARLSRGHYQHLADRVAAWFLPVIVVIAGLTLLWHRSAGIGPAIQHSLSVLLIACPCALGLATPLAVWTALSTAVRRQVLFRSGEAIERLAEVKVLCFDKTGTLTTGTPQVQRTCVLNAQCECEVLAQASELADTSTHPFSQAIRRLAASRPDVQTRRNERLTDIRSVPGQGVEAFRSDRTRLRLGSVEFAFAEMALTPGRRMLLTRILATADQEAASVVALSVGDQPIAVFVLTETLRLGAASALRQCADLGLSLTVLTGDRAAQAEQLRENLLNSDVANRTSSSQPIVPIALSVESELQPEEKVRRLLQIREQRGSAAMVGDGVNDAPALAASDVGIAMGCGADVSRESAEVCLLTSELDRIPWAIRFARRTRSVIRQNLLWAFGYNSVGVAFAAAGLLNPVVAAALMIVSSLLVISNSMRLLADENPERGLT